MDRDATPVPTYEERVDLAARRVTVSGATLDDVVRGFVEAQIHANPKVRAFEVMTVASRFEADVLRRVHEAPASAAPVSRHSD